MYYKWTRCKKPFTCSCGEAVVAGDRYGYKEDHVDKALGQYISIKRCGACAIKEGVVEPLPTGLCRYFMRALLCRGGVIWVNDHFKSAPVPWKQISQCVANEWMGLINNKSEVGAYITAKGIKRMGMEGYYANTDA